MFDRSKWIWNMVMVSNGRILIFSLNYVLFQFLGNWSIFFLAFGTWWALILDPAGKAIDQKYFCSWDFLCYRLMKKMSVPILFFLHWFLLMDGNSSHRLGLRLILMVLTFNLSVFPHTLCHWAERMRCDDNWQELIVCVSLVKSSPSWSSCIWMFFLSITAPLSVCCSLRLHVSLPPRNVAKR